ncbi:ATP-binding cassette domain-containing protein [Olsenella profusa]|uniref:ABC transporter ATP-binding protein n=1 Tax=Olsenella profusa TaxID=138595 RepID=A0ABS2F3Q9_9ACTN|nr:ABC transporter ATP-binding protein [Olsenella profusa]MBM6775530.1 ABC transporter ATP-binding protein [Olsenella profusa]
MRRQTAYPVLDVTPRNVLYALCQVVVTVSGIVAGVLVGDIVDGVAQGRTLLEIARDTCVLAGVYVLSAALSFVLGNWLPQKVNIAKQVGASVETVHNVLYLSQTEFEKEGRGHYLNLAFGSSFTYGDLYASMNILCVGCVLSVVAILAFACAVSPWLAGIFLLYVPLYYVATDRPCKATLAAQEEYLPRRESWLDAGRKMIEEKRSISAAHAVRFFEESFDKSNDSFVSFMKRFQLLDAIAEGLPAALGGVLQVVTLMAGFALFSAGSLSTGQVVTAYQLSLLLRAPMSKAAMLRSYYVANKAHVERLRSLASRAAEPSGFGALRGGEAGPVVARLDGALYADASRSGEPLFRARGIEVRAGSLVVVKGPNGSGKSRLLDFLAGLSDPACLDGRAELSPELASCDYLTYPVPVVAGTLADNMLGARPDPAAARALGLGDLASREITDQPLNLSLGERQKIGLLRALSGGSPVLLLDEPLTNLDGAAREGLCRLVEGMRGERTVVAVMHSGELDGAADQILEVRGGELERVK